MKYIKLELDSSTSIDGIYDYLSVTVFDSITEDTETFTCNSNDIKQFDIRLKRPINIESFKKALIDLNNKLEVRHYKRTSR